MDPVRGWMMGSTANGIWENYHMASEHMNIATSFLKELYKNGKFATNFFAI
jgi:hypothetical protein